MAKPVTLNEAYVKNVKNAPPFGTKDKIGYMLGDLGFNSLQVIVNSYLMLFCVNILGINAVHFASIVFICKALDALNDTFIGQTVDNRPATKYGKMKPYLKWFAIPYMIFTIVLFMDVTAMPYAAKIAWVLVIYFIWGIVGTFINVPYGAMTNIMTTDLVQRTELSNFRSIGSALGNIVPTTVAPLLLFDANNDPIASRFIVLSVVLGIFCVVCLYAAHALMKERVLVTPDSNISAAGEKVNYWQVAKSFAKNRVMIAVVLGYVVTKLFTQPVGTINQYVFMVYFQDTALLSLTALTSMIPMVIGMILIKPLVKRFGKKNLVTWPILGAAACYGITAFLPMTPMIWIICQLGAACFTAASGLLLWSMEASFDRLGVGHDEVTISKQIVKDYYDLTCPCWTAPLPVPMKRPVSARVTWPGWVWPSRGTSATHKNREIIAIAEIGTVPSQQACNMICFENAQWILDL